MRFRELISIILVMVVPCNIVAQADVFNMKAGLISLEMVSVGQVGNAGEWSGESYGGYGPDRICGAVSYAYNIGKYEVTAGQYTEFLNAKAKTDTYELYNFSMWNDTWYGCKIERNGTSGNYTYRVASNYANRPVNFVSFWNAARFANWLNNGQGDGDTETGAYTLNGYNGIDGRAIIRNKGAKWFIPNEDEWYKAAYHRNDGVTGNYWDYPTATDVPSTPGRDMIDADGYNANYYGDLYPIDSGMYVSTNVGEFQSSDSPYGTFDQGGNVWEWNETVVYELETESSRGIRGGSFNHYSDALLAYSRNQANPTYVSNGNLGFRVASVPEPDCLAMMIAIVMTVLLCWSWKSSKSLPIGPQSNRASTT